MAAAAPVGLSVRRSVRLAASSRPRRSYHGPFPMRSLALTVEVLRKACQVLLLWQADER